MPRRLTTNEDRAATALILGALALAIAATLGSIWLRLAVAL